MPQVSRVVAAFRLVCEIAEQALQEIRVASAQKVLARPWDVHSRPYAIGHFPKKGILFMRRRSTSVVVLPNTNYSAIDARLK